MSYRDVSPPPATRDPDFEQGEAVVVWVVGACLLAFVVLAVALVLVLR